MLAGGLRPCLSLELALRPPQLSCTARPCLPLVLMCRRHHDNVITQLEQRVAAWTKYNISHQEDIQVLRCERCGMPCCARRAAAAAAAAPAGASAALPVLPAAARAPD